MILSFTNFTYLIFICGHTKYNLFFASSGSNVNQMHSLRKLELKRKKNKNNVRKNPVKYAKYSVAFVFMIVRIKCVSKRKCHERKNIMTFGWNFRICFQWRLKAPVKTMLHIINMSRFQVLVLKTSTDA